MRQNSSNFGGDILRSKSSSFTTQKHQKVKAFPVVGPTHVHLASWECFPLLKETPFLAMLLWSIVAANHRDDQCRYYLYTMANQHHCLLGFPFKFWGLKIVVFWYPLVVLIRIIN
jgi:hypothetical protein